MQTYSPVGQSRITPFHELPTEHSMHLPYCYTTSFGTTVSMSLWEKNKKEARELKETPY